MGYTTDFEGQIAVEPPLNVKEMNFLKKFNETRRMDREKGPYYVDGTGPMGQGNDPDVRSFNAPAAGQPGLWCSWVPTEDGDAIEWSGMEKFYDSAEWMAYIINHFLGTDPLAKGELDFLQGHTLNGTIEAQGEEPDDKWLLHVTDNVVEVEDYTAPIPSGERTRV